MSAALSRMEDDFQARKRARLLATLGYSAVLVGLLYVSALVSEAYPSSLAAGLPRVGEYFHKLLPTLKAEALLGGVKTEGSIAYWFYRLDAWAWLLFETSQMAALATLGGAVVALALCFPAAANLAPTRTIYVVFRRTLELFRTVPDIVYALILVWAFGIGPLAGILAIGLHTVGALGKLFSEVVENADMRPWDGVPAAQPRNRSETRSIMLTVRMISRMIAPVSS
jgi:phosphonate transport system permease protein